MQNNAPAGSYQGRGDPLAQSENSLSYDPSQSLSAPEALGSSQNEQVQQRRSLISYWRGILIVLATLSVIGMGIFSFISRDTSSRLEIGSFGSLRLPLNGILSHDQATDRSQSLKVNGRLEVNESIVLTPTSQPDDASTGQLYFDDTTRRLTYYDGEQFLEIQGATVGATQIINNSTSTTINNIGGGSDLVFEGTAGTIPIFTGNSSLGNSLLRQNGTALEIATSGASAITMGSSTTQSVAIDGGAIQLGNSAGNHDIQIGNGAGTQTVQVGSLYGASKTSIQGGTGNLSLETGGNSGITGSISITTGDSSTTASGNITIDAGEGIVSGEIVANKTFEGGVDRMTTWFGSTIAQSTAQSHSGAYSLAATTTDPFWGVIELLPGTSVIPGHQYYFSLWVRANSAPRTINTTVVWQGTGGQIVTLAPTVNSNSGWTEITGVAAAPATATSAYFRVSSSGATIGEIHYFDDMTVTDLSSSSAISAIKIGAENAKIITIGNLNQIGATSIYGSSGISLNSGAAGITMNGGVLSMTGNAASALSTSTGALTLTSADSATWGVGRAVAGVGGNLTLTGGNGGDDSNNNGGDLILQGGAPNGTGIGGSVIVRPQNDSTDAFQIQNNAGTPLLTADSSTMAISISGTDTGFATLSLENAHFGVSQATPPTASTPTNCGTGGSAVITPGSTDSAGSFTITTGTGGSASTCDTSLTFHQAYNGNPKSIIVVGKDTADSAARQVYVVSTTTAAFDVSFGVSAAGADNTDYHFNYWVIE